MKQCFLVAMLLGLAGAAHAEWQFSSKLDVAPQHNGDKVFHHLDASGRANLAVSGNVLAVVWEDNQAGSPQVYVAYKNLTAKTFAKPIRLSTGEEAYEPGIISLGQGRFAIAWEQDGHIWLRTTTAKQTGEAKQLSNKAGRQVSLLKLSADTLMAAWCESEAGNHYIVTAPVTLQHKRSKAGAVRVVDRHTAQQNQSYPVLGKVGNEVGVIWEDRRRRVLRAPAGRGP